MIVRYLGYLLVISAFFRIIPISVGILNDESIILFLLSSFISLVFGILLIAYEKRKTKKKVELNLTKGLILATLSFTLLPLISAISFLPAFDYNLLNAYFESISGFTTTGMTLFGSVESLPKSLLIWRAETQWMGGIGIITFFLFIISRLHFHDYVQIADVERSTKATVALYQAQGFTDKLEGGLKKTISTVLSIYIIYTILGILFLFLTGMSLFESSALAFTSLSTGGFAVTDTFRINHLQLIILSVLMILGSFSFITHHRLFQRKWKEFFTAFEKNIFLLFILIAVIIVSFTYTNLVSIIFHLVSAFSTTGFAYTNISLLPEVFFMMIIMGMFVGGSIASTSGGIKVYRIYYLLRSIPWSIKKLSLPTRAIIPLTIHGKEQSETRIMNIGIFVFTYLFLLFVGTMLFMIYKYPFTDAIFQISSALGTVGLQTVDLMNTPPLLKGVLILAMLFGRLEIFPVLILFRSFFAKKY